MSGRREGLVWERGTERKRKRKREKEREAIEEEWEKD